MSITIHIISITSLVNCNVLVGSINYYFLYKNSDEEDDDEEEEEDNDDDEEEEEDSSEKAETTLESSQDGSNVDVSKLSRSQKRRLKKKLQKEKQPQVNGVDKPKV